ncbi:alpha-amylase [Bifidobacterium dolichotidis]|uniref:Alpha-amylase n=1 Tax=Bifidobacterium dolichotidis TaxID=2306976 RepID=A0A430FP16_9BIFI|nr:hypothetical protein [Bifidobacterium dolichotidis]RSX54569.1 alpha-amylase [Bifidobacterium dolichotidis]
MKQSNLYTATKTRALAASAAAVSLAMVTGSLALSTGAFAATVTNNDHPHGIDQNLIPAYETMPPVDAQRTIDITQGLRDWSPDLLLAKGLANDDMHAYTADDYARWNSIPVDMIALYGAYDGEYLYLMWEMSNPTDVVEPNNIWALNNGKLNESTTRDYPFFIVISTDNQNKDAPPTDKTIENNAKTADGKTIWDSGNEFTQGATSIVAIHSSLGNKETKIFYGGKSGLNPVGEDAEATVNAGSGILHDSSVNGLLGFGKSRKSTEVQDPSTQNKVIDLSTVHHDISKYDFHYQVQIPLSKLDTTVDDIKVHGLGVQVVSTCSAFNAIGTDSLPYDMATKTGLEKGHGNAKFSAPFAILQ